MAKLLYFLIFTFTSLVSFGQENNDTTQVKRNSILVDLGVVNSRLIDQGYTASNLLFRGTNFKLNLGYRKEAKKWLFDFSVSGAAGNVQSKSGSLPSDLYFVQLSVDYLRKVKTWSLLGKQNIFFVGILASSINYGLQNDPVIDNLDVFSVHGIYAGFYNQLQINKRQRLQVSYSLPIVVYNNRVLWNSGASKYTYYDKDHVIDLLTTHGKVTYFNVARNIELKIAYLIRIGRGTDFEINYRFFYLNSPVEAPVRIYTNELLVGFRFNF